MKKEKILNLLKNKGEIYKENDYIYLRYTRPAIHYEDRFNAVFKIYKNKLIADITSIQEMGYSCGNYKEYKRTLKKTYYFNKKKELEEIIDVLTNSLIMKTYWNGHGSFRDIDYLKQYVSII